MSRYAIAEPLSRDGQRKRKFTFIKGKVQVQHLFFIILLSAIMHRTTIVQNGIINIICFVFFVQANIKRPNLKD